MRCVREFNAFHKTETRMHPILIQIGPLTLRWYGLLIALGFLAAHLLFRKRAARLGLEEAAASNLLVLLLLAGIVGARIYFVVWNWKDIYSVNPWEAFMIQKGGQVFFGGFVAACVTLVLWCRWKKLPLAPLADALSAPLALGHAIGRLGCFMNGCCHGRACDYLWAVSFQSPAEIAGQPVHPTQIYEMVALLDICATLMIIEKIARYPGQVIFSYCILYSFFRFLIEFFRGDVSHEILGHFTLAQAICAVVFLAAWFGAARSSRRAALARRARLNAAESTG